ncbi:unnamed protein product [Effrenium voratum]|nr:unnamed protein product [Effrenium voratum]
MPILQWFGVRRCADLSSWCRAPCGSRARRSEPCCSTDCCLTYVGLYKLISKKKRTAHALRGARDKCVRLMREAVAANDHSAPQEHLRAAARHLAAVERWLLPEVLKHSSTTSLRLTDPEELASELGLQSLAGGEDLEDFMEFFGTAVGMGELLVLAIPSLVQSKTFRHPGTCYITSERLCFRSCVLGMEARFTLTWSQLEWVRLITEDSSLHPVRLRLKRSVEIDAVSVDTLDLMVFDLGVLAQFHCCVSYFTGTGLFDMVPSADQEPVDDKSPSGMRDILSSGPRTRISAVTTDEMVADLEEMSLVWELQRRTTIWHTDWRAPFLPHDYQKAIKWMAIEDHYVPHPFIPEDIDVDEAAESEEPPITKVKFLGRYRPCQWSIVVDETSDREGWQYAVDFYLEPGSWSCGVRGFSHVRRRRWQPTFLPDMGEVQEESPGSRAAKRLNSTLMAEKGVSPPQVILEVDLGLIPLEDIRKDLEGDWEVRSMSMRVPVPPAPMCPKESRCACTWHLVADEKRLLLESVIMSLDVPYGTCFNVIKCDTFSVDPTGNILFERKLSLEWVKFCWVKALVEARNISGIPNGIPNGTPGARAPGRGGGGDAVSSGAQQFIRAVVGPNVRYRWLRGPVVKPCYYHPHKMSQIKDVAKTHLCYCSKECFLKGYYTIPKAMWGTKDDVDKQEQIAEWVEVANTRSYCPGKEDIDRPLRLEITPLVKGGRDATTGGMTITTGTVIPTPKEARCRRMVTNGPTFNAEWLNKQFKVMNWNVLADLYATESVYPYCEKWALSWTWRKHLIMKELKSMAADIITLQEVQKDAYDEWFRPQLAEAGYEGVFQQKKRDPIFHRGKYTAEGCATFYKVTRFRRVDKQVVDYDRESAMEIRQNTGWDIENDKSLQRLSKGNVALAILLEDLQIKASPNSGQAGQHGGHCLVVVNTHILCDPTSSDVKLWQSHLLIQCLKHLQWDHWPLLLAGDFNSTPDSAVYEYLNCGSIREDHKDLQHDPSGLLRRFSRQLQHQLCLATAYAICNGREASFTNYTEDFQGTLDYIWFSPDALSVLAITQVDDEAELKKEQALPSSTRPSDHVSLVATFMFHEHPERKVRHQHSMNHAYHHLTGLTGPGAWGDYSGLPNC